MKASIVIRACRACGNKLCGHAQLAHLVKRCSTVIGSAPQVYANLGVRSFRELIALKRDALHICRQRAAGRRSIA